MAMCVRNTLDIQIEQVALVHALANFRSPGDCILFGFKRTRDTCETILMPYLGAGWRTLGDVLGKDRGVCRVIGMQADYDSMTVPIDAYLHRSSTAMLVPTVPSSIRFYLPHPACGGRLAWMISGRADLQLGNAHSSSRFRFGGRDNDGRLGRH